MKSLTSANSILMLGVTGLYPIPQQIQGFATDDLFDSEAVTPTETMMGVDGKLSAGLVNVPIVQNFALQADSDSNDFFEAWYAAMKALQDVYFAFGVIELPSVKRTYVMTKGALSGFAPTPDGKKVLQPRKFKITWESIVAAPISA